MSSAPESGDPPAAPGNAEISAAAQIARERLHREIERVRDGVEEMLDEQEAQGRGAERGKAQAPAVAEMREELESLRIETRNYVKKKVRKSEKKLARSVREIDARTDALERRIDQVEVDRHAAEWRIHTSTEEMLDGLLDEIRSIADRLSERPAPAPEPAEGQAPSGRGGPRLGMRKR